MPMMEEFSQSKRNMDSAIKHFMDSGEKIINHFETEFSSREELDKKVKDLTAVAAKQNEAIEKLTEENKVLNNGYKLVQETLMEMKREIEKLKKSNVCKYRECDNLLCSISIAL